MLILKEKNINSDIRQLIEFFLMKVQSKLQKCFTFEDEIEMLEQIRDIDGIQCIDNYKCN